MTNTHKSVGTSNTERAFWSFLMITLVAPFLAAIVIFLASISFGWFGRGPASLLALDQWGQLGWAAQKAVETYVWSAMPAGLGAAFLALIVYVRGSAHWLVGVTLGAVAASVMAFLGGGMLQQHLTPMAFIGALVGLAMIYLLKRARIII
jgi:hypothetical protein